MQSRIQKTICQQSLKRTRSSVHRRTGAASSRCSFSTQHKMCFTAPVSSISTWHSIMDSRRWSSTQSLVPTSTHSHTANNTDRSDGPILVQKRNKVFVSKYNQSLNITSEQITDYCSNHGISQNELRVSNT